MSKNIKIAKELVKLAKILVAGPGAGIEFKIKESSGESVYHTTVSLNDDGSVDTIESELVSNNIAIDKFDAHGYYDGASDADGKTLLKDVEIENAEDYISDAIRFFFKHPENCSKETQESIVETLKEGVDVKVFLNYDAITNCMFGGYSRPRLTEGSVIEFQNGIDVIFDDSDCFWLNDNTVEGKVTAKLTAEGATWYDYEFMGGRLKDEEDE